MSWGCTRLGVSCALPTGPQIGLPPTSQWQSLAPRWEEDVARGRTRPFSFFRLGVWLSAFSTSLAVSPSSTPCYEVFRVYSSLLWFRSFFSHCYQVQFFGPGCAAYPPSRALHVGAGIRPVSALGYRDLTTSPCQACSGSGVRLFSPHDLLRQACSGLGISVLAPRSQVSSRARALLNSPRLIYARGLRARRSS